DERTADLRELLEQEGDDDPGDNERRRGEHPRHHPPPQRSLAPLRHLVASPVLVAVESYQGERVPRSRELVAADARASVAQPAADIGLSTAQHCGIVTDAGGHAHTPRDIGRTGKRGHAMASLSRLRVPKTVSSIALTAALLVAGLPASSARAQDAIFELGQPIVTGFAGVVPPEVPPEGSDP